MGLKDVVTLVAAIPATAATNVRTYTPALLPEVNPIPAADTNIKHRRNSTQPRETTGLACIVSSPKPDPWRECHDS